MYLGWFDDNPRKPTADKISEACAAYRKRFGVQPNIALVSRDDADVQAEIATRAEGYIRRNNFWIGWDEAYRAA